MEIVLTVVVAVIGVWIAFAIVVWATGRDTLLDLSPAGAPFGLGEEEPVSESAVGALRFDTGLRGYRTDQVDAAMTRLAWEIGRRDEQLEALREELAQAGSRESDEDGGEPFEESFDEDTFRLAKGEADGEAGRDDEGEATPRGGA